MQTQVLDSWFEVLDKIEWNRRWYLTVFFSLELAAAQNLEKLESMGELNNARQFFKKSIFDLHRLAGWLSVAKLPECVFNVQIRGQWFQASIKFCYHVVVTGRRGRGRAGKRGGGRVEGGRGERRAVNLHPILLSVDQLYAPSCVMFSRLPWIVLLTLLLTASNAFPILSPIPSNPDPSGGRLCSALLSVSVCWDRLCANFNNSQTKVSYGGKKGME